jgi:hypothetical protein
MGDYYISKGEKSRPQMAARWYYLYPCFYFTSGTYAEIKKFGLNSRAAQVRVRALNASKF